MKKSGETEMHAGWPNGPFSFELRLICLVVGIAGAIVLWSMYKWWSVLGALAFAVDAVVFLRRSTTSYRIRGVVLGGLAMGIGAMSLLELHGPIIWGLSEIFRVDLGFGALQQVLFAPAAALLFAPCAAYLLGFWNGAWQKVPLWTSIGWLPSGTIFGAYFGGLIGSAVATSNRATASAVSGMLLGVLLGLWLGVDIDAFLRRNQVEQRRPIGTVVCFNFAILIALTAAILVIRSRWMDGLVR